MKLDVGDLVKHDGRIYRCISEHGDLEEIGRDVMPERLYTRPPRTVWVQWSPISGPMVKEEPFKIIDGAWGRYELVDDA